MLGNKHATSVVGRWRRLWARAGVSLVAAGALASPCCDGLHAETRCVKATATDLSCSGGVTTGYLDIEVSDDDDCPLIESAEMLSYNNRDGVEGFDPDNGDILVNTLTAITSPPTDTLTMGQFSSGHSSGTIQATHWQLVVGNADGTHSAFSGNY